MEPNHHHVLLLMQTDRCLKSSVFYNGIFIAIKERLVYVKLKVVRAQTQPRKGDPISLQIIHRPTIEPAKVSIKYKI